LKPVGTGEVGEICIGGSTVAQGYWNQPELTAKKFIRNPLGEDDTEYLYRTGDRGYILDDGQVAYLGRIDLQGNLRGIRVDYGEIESLLGMHPAIDSAVVTTRDDMADDQTLVAYYVRAPGTSAISASDLSTFLSAKLPAGLIPSCFLEVDGFRINRAGKVDRKSLPAPWEIENRTHARDVTRGNHWNGRSRRSGKPS
jgi:acyl-CoA synthetase (AMP-forming)/AMP-acid ligase II